MRKLFQQAAQAAPSIVFIDEIDAIGRKRRGSGEAERVSDEALNELLTQMDGFDSTESGVMVMAATNLVDVLDPALVRSNRFDRIIECPLPNRFAIISCQH